MNVNVDVDVDVSVNVNMDVDVGVNVNVNVNVNRNVHISSNNAIVEHCMPNNIYTCSSLLLPSASTSASSMFSYPLVLIAIMSPILPPQVEVE